MVTDETSGDVDVAAQLAERFGLGSVSRPMDPVAEGVMGQVFELHADTGRWAVKRFFEPVDVDAAEIDLLLQESAAAAGVTLPRPVRSVTGSPVVCVDGRDWRAYAWMDVRLDLTVPVATPVAATVGATLAALHGLALPAPCAPSPWLTEPPPARAWHDLVERTTSAGVGWATTLTEAMPAITLLTDLGQRAPALPTVLCHCDVIPANVGFSPDGDFVVLDWEHAGALPPVRELGYVLTQFCLGPGGVVDTAGARTLVDAYRATGGSLPALDLEMFAASACAWLNFTTEMASATLDGDDPEYEEFGRRTLAALLADPPRPPRLERLLAAIR